MNEFHLAHLPLSEFGRQALADLHEDFLNPLTSDELELVAAACIALDVVTRGTKAPRAFQLEVMLSILAGRDCVVQAATGSGKTLAMLLPQLIYPEDVVLTVSPLKLLQRAQVEEFNAYGIPSIAINEDTEFTPKLCQDLRSGAIKHIVTSPEQLTVVRGIVTRFGRMMHETTFTVRIKRVNVDECHFIKTAGMATGTDPPFRFAFGKLGELRVFLGCGIVFTAFSATMPEDVAQEVMVCLRMKESNTDIIRLSSNRENLSYGVIRMLGSIKNFANVKFLVPSELSETATLVDLRKGVLFIENKVLAARIAEYLNALLPIQLRRFEPIRHLHSSMSPGYITQTYGEFAKPDGNVRLLVATGTAAHGLDLRDLEYVVCFGVPEILLDLEQKLGRCCRDGKTSGFAVVIAEPWVCEDTGNHCVESNTGTISSNAKTRSKRIRTEQPVRLFMQTEDCKRSFLQQYNHDTSDTALAFTCPICCDARIHGTEYEAALCEFFKSKLAKDLPNEPKAAKQRKRRGGRLKVQRPELEKLLKDWLRKIHEEDQDYAGFPSGYILSSTNLDTLVAARPTFFGSPNEIKDYLNETDEWATDFSHSLYRIIKDYDSGLEFKRLMEGGATRTTKNTTTAEHLDNVAGSDADADDSNTQDHPDSATEIHQSTRSNFSASDYENARNHIMQLMSGPSTENQENAPPPGSPGSSRPSKRRRTAFNNATNKL